MDLYDLPCRITMGNSSTSTICVGYQWDGMYQLQYNLVNGLPENTEVIAKADPISWRYIDANGVNDGYPNPPYMTWGERYGLGANDYNPGTGVVNSIYGCMGATTEVHLNQQLFDGVTWNKGWGDMSHYAGRDQYTWRTGWPAHLWGDLMHSMYCIVILPRMLCPNAKMWLNPGDVPPTAGPILESVTIGPEVMPGME